MDHVVDGAGAVSTGTTEAHEDCGRTTVACLLAAGREAAGGEVPRVRLVEPALPAGAARPGGRRAGRRARLDRLGRPARRSSGTTSTSSGTAPTSRSRATPRSSRRCGSGCSTSCRPAPGPSSGPIAAKGLTGPGYDGHAFWDTETFVLPVLTYTQPDAAADALRWRHSTLTWPGSGPKQLGLQGAAFPWRTIRGQECSGYWPAGTAAFHINADIADAVRALRRRHRRRASSSARSASSCWCETARLWRSLGHHDRHGRFHIDGVTGPDEYSAVADDNVYTNLMAQQNLLAAADAASRHPDVADAAGRRRRGDRRPGATRRRRCTSRTTSELGVHQQCEGFTGLQEWDFADTPPEEYPLLLHFPYFDLYRKQVVKQADLVLAMHCRGDAFTAEEKARNFAYYEAPHGAGLLAVGLHPGGDGRRGGAPGAGARLPRRGGADGPARPARTTPATACTWRRWPAPGSALVAGLGGMRDRDGRLSFAPRLPSGIRRLGFRVRYRGRRLVVTANHGEATYRVLEGPPITVRHYGEELELAGEPVARPIPEPPNLPRPAQPPGREPARRGSAHGGRDSTLSP